MSILAKNNIIKSKKSTLLLLLLLASVDIFAQDTNTAPTITITVRREHLPLSCVYSASNTLYTNVTNIVRVNRADTGFGKYEIETDMGYINRIENGEFMIVKHNPGSMILNLWKYDSNGIRRMVASQEFTVSRLPTASIIIGGTIIDSSASIKDLTFYKHLDIVFGDFSPMNDMCFIKSFDLLIDKHIYHSESSTITDEMLNAISTTKSTVQFENVKATINSPDDVEQTLTADKKHRVMTQRVYNVEELSKPIVLLR